MSSKFTLNYTGQACSIDQEKAFDTLDQYFFSTKMDYYGFRGPVSQLLAR